jgi:hypothetical protein
VPKKLKVNQHKRRFIHEMFWYTALRWVQQSRTVIWDFTHKYQDGLTPGEIKHLLETRDMLEECHKRLLVIYARLKK